MALELRKKTRGTRYLAAAPAPRGPRGCAGVTSGLPWLRPPSTVAKIAFEIPIRPLSADQCAALGKRSSDRALWHVLKEYVVHDHAERPHQGKGNVILFPSNRPDQDREGVIHCHEWLGGLLKYYNREAACVF